jgi:hypothetical protein
LQRFEELGNQRQNDRPGFSTLTWIAPPHPQVESIITNKCRGQGDVTMIVNMLETRRLEALQSSHNSDMEFAVFHCLVLLQYAFIDDFAPEHGALIKDDGDI